MKKPLAWRLGVFLLVAVVMGWGFDVFSFGLVHSSGAYLMFLVSPGLLVIFAGESLPPVMFWSVVILINVIYYEILFRLMSLGKRRLFRSGANGNE
jgi:hypothetical protein